MSDTPNNQKEFTIKRKNLTKLSEEKEKDSEKEKGEGKEKETEKGKEKAKEKTKVDTRYQKRQPLTKVESDFLTDFYYKKSGYSGRDVLYKQLQAEYEKHSTPQNMRVSRRRMWEFFLSRQEVNQLHRQARKTSLAIKPINSKNKLDRAQFDLIIRGGDSARKYKGIGCMIDIATRKAWTEVLTSTTSKAVAAAMDKMLARVYDELSDKEKEERKDREANGKSRTFSVIMTDNGSEMKLNFSKLLKDKNIAQVYGVANRSSSQSAIERFNQTLQSGMERERTATGERWFNLVKKHTDFYNDKTNRNLRLKDPDDEDATFKVYTPNELWDADKETLARLFANKDADAAQGNKVLNNESDLEIGNTVRLVDLGKRKSAMAKGFKMSWSKELYEIYKIQRPKLKESSRPYKFYVKEQGTDKQRKDANGRAIAYTVNDLQVLRNGVQKAPDDIQVKEKEGASTRARAGGDDEAPSTPPPPKPKPAPKANAPKAPKAPPKEDDLIGKTVVSYIDLAKGNREVTVKGAIVNKQKRKKGASSVWYYRVKWDDAYSDQYDYKEFEYIKKSEVVKLLEKTA